MSWTKLQKARGDVDAKPYERDWRVPISTGGTRGQLVMNNVACPSPLQSRGASHSYTSFLLVFLDTDAPFHARRSVHKEVAAAHNAGVQSMDEPSAARGQHMRLCTG